MSPRAVAHDRVLTWASDSGGGAVVPMPMFSLFSGPAAVQHMLRERSSQLAETLERVARGREYALRVYRVDAELMESMTAFSPRLAELASKAAAATPGQRYLLERKLEDEKRAEMRGVTMEIVDEIVGALAVHTHRRRQIADPARHGRGGTRADGAQRRVPCRARPFERVSADTHVARRAARGARLSLRLHRPVAAVSLRRRERRRRRGR